MKKFNLILLSIFCIACQNQKYTETTYVESKHIHIPNSNIDIITRQEIFEKLYEIYQIKKEAIEEQIKASLFSTHQEDAYMHIDSIINKYNIKIMIGRNHQCLFRKTKQKQIRLKVSLQQ